MEQNGPSTSIAPTTFRAIVIHWEQDEPPKHEELDRALQELFRDTGVCPRIGRYSDDPDPSIVVSALPLAPEHAEWIIAHWFTARRNTEFGWEFDVPTELPAG